MDEGVDVFETAGNNRMLITLAITVGADQLSWTPYQAYPELPITICVHLVRAQALHHT
jgi:hypothetical protein